MTLTLTFLTILALPHLRWLCGVRDFNIVATGMHVVVGVGL